MSGSARSWLLHHLTLSWLGLAHWDSRSSILQWLAFEIIGTRIFLEEKGLYFIMWAGCTIWQNMDGVKAGCAGLDNITLNLTLCIQWTARWPGFAFTLRTQNIKYNYLVSDHFSSGFFRLKVLWKLKESKWKFSKVHAFLGLTLISNFRLKLTEKRKIMAAKPVWF